MLFKVRETSRNLEFVGENCKPFIYMCTKVEGLENGFVYIRDGYVHRHMNLFFSHFVYAYN